MNHPLSHLTTYVNCNLHSGQKQGHMLREVVGIENDAWIGREAIVVRSLKIGDGKLIGAGAVDVKDEPPYSLAVGNPARVVRRRFPDDIMVLLLHLCWWVWPPDQIVQHAAMFEGDSRKQPEKYKCRLQTVITARDVVLNSSESAAPTA